MAGCFLGSTVSNGVVLYTPAGQQVSVGGYSSVGSVESMRLAEQNPGAPVYVTQGTQGGAVNNAMIQVGLNPFPGGAASGSAPSLNLATTAGVAIYNPPGTGAPNPGAGAGGGGTFVPGYSGAQMQANNPGPFNLGLVYIIAG
jgi:hypothetical protein